MAVMAPADIFMLALMTSLYVFVVVFYSQLTIYVVFFADDCFIRDKYFVLFLCTFVCDVVLEY